MFNITLSCNANCVIDYKLSLLYGMHGFCVVSTNVALWYLFCFNEWYVFANLVFACKLLNNTLWSAHLCCVISNVCKYSKFVVNNSFVFYQQKVFLFTSANPIVTFRYDKLKCYSILSSNTLLITNYYDLIIFE